MLNAISIQCAFARQSILVRIEWKVLSLTPEKDRDILLRLFPVFINA